MAFIKCPEPECTKMVSDQATACPECGCSIRKTEYKFVTVTHSFHYGGYGGKAELDALLKDGWQVVEQSEEEQINDRGEAYGYHWKYKLQK